MKIHCNSDHPDYHPLGMKCKVRLAGSERKNVVFADEERRYAIVHKLDDNGDPVQADGMYVYEDFRGDVYIDCPPEVREQIEADRAGAAASPAYVMQDSLPVIHIDLREVSAAAIKLVQAGRKEVVRHIIGKHGGRGLRLSGIPAHSFAACHAELVAELNAGPPLNTDDGSTFIPAKRYEPGDAELRAVRAALQKLGM